MDVTTARDVAEQKLRDIDTEFPLRLSGGKNDIVELDEVWVFGFNSIRYLDEGDFLAAILSGPIVVPKDGSPAWVAPSAYPVEKSIELHGPHGDRRPDAQ